MSRIKSLCAALPKLDTANLIPKPALHKFTIFQELPCVLRNKIWQLAPCEPCKIKLAIANRSYDEPNANVKGQTRHPGILQACRESREEGLRHYERCYERRLPMYDYELMRAGAMIPYVTFPQKLDVKANTIYINFGVDLFLDDRVDENPPLQCLNLDKSTLVRIERLEIMQVSSKQRTLRNRAEAVIQLSAPNLESIMYVAIDRSCCELERGVPGELVRQMQETEFLTSGVNFLQRFHVKNPSTVLKFKWKSEVEDLLVPCAERTEQR